MPRTKPVAYFKVCKDCHRIIILNSMISPGKWVPLEPDGNSHACGSAPRIDWNHAVDLAERYMAVSSPSGKPDLRTWGNQIRPTSLRGLVSYPNQYPNLWKREELVGFFNALIAHGSVHALEDGFRSMELRVSGRTFATTPATAVPTPATAVPPPVSTPEPTPEPEIEIISTEPVPTEPEPTPEPAFSGYLNRPHDREIRKWVSQMHAEGGTPIIGLAGSTGTGKSETAEELARRLGLKLIMVSIDPQSPPKSMLVQREIRGNDTVSVKTPLAVGIETGNHLICFDEINMIPPSLLSPFHSLFTTGRVFVPELGGELVMGSGTVIILTWNPGYCGTQPLNPAFLARIQYLIEVPCFTGEELAKITGLDPTITAAFSRLNENLLTEKRKASIGIREVKTFAKMRDLLGEETAKRVLVDRLVSMDASVRSLVQAELEHYI